MTKYVPIRSKHLGLGPLGQVIRENDFFTHWASGPLVQFEDFNSHVI